MPEPRVTNTNTVTLGLDPRVLFHFAFLHRLKLVSRMRGNDNKIKCHSRESGKPAKPKHLAAAFK